MEGMGRDLRVGQKKKLFLKPFLHSPARSEPVSKHTRCVAIIFHYPAKEVCRIGRYRAEGPNRVRNSGLPVNSVAKYTGKTQRARQAIIAILFYEGMYRFPSAIKQAPDPQKIQRVKRIEMNKTS